MDIGYTSDIGNLVLDTSLCRHFHPSMTVSPRHGGLCFADITYLPLKVVEGEAEVKTLNEKCRESKQLPEIQSNCLECSLFLDVYAFVLG